MAITGYGSKLMSAWGQDLDVSSATLLYRVIQPGDADTIEQDVWRDWFFEAAAVTTGSPWFMWQQ